MRKKKLTTDHVEKITFLRQNYNNREKKNYHKNDCLWSRIIMRLKKKFPDPRSTPEIVPGPC